ncbi:MAG: hypothetical protein C0483_11240 [Pirellula sp.]|nr:hypothetical protein [Pirellula sp.]
MVARFVLGLLVAIGLLQTDALAVDATSPISARFAGSDARPSYQKHVLPLMSKVGCSGRACHGSFQGQGGFRLSLFGYDFKQDFEALLGGDEPRVNLKSPHDSLILRKPTMQEEHGGEKLFDVGSWQYNILARWIETGAKDDSADNPAIDRLEIQPTELMFKKPGETMQLRVLAHWADGAVEDVTDLTRFRTNDESVAKVDEKTGVVRAEGAGDTHIVAFYDNGVAPVAALLPVGKQAGPDYPKVAAPTKVDELIVAKLRKLGIVPSELCTDEEFLRRASLDIGGTLPSPAEIRVFKADTSSDKRTKKIDELLARPTYVAWWTTVLCDITGNNTNQLEIAGKYHEQEWSRIWYDWIYRRVAENVPYDEMMAGLVLAVSRRPEQSYEDYCAEMTSYVRSEKPADFTGNDTLPQFWGRRNMQKPEEKALVFSYTFLGVRLQCAECHKHPFDQWTQQDFQSFQAFFTGVAYKRQDRRDPVVAQMMRAVGVEPDEGKANGNNPGRRLAQAARDGKTVPFPELIARLDAVPGTKAYKELKSVKGGSRVITPKVLGGEEVVLASYADPREPLMNWMRSADNPYFARAWVNRVWQKYFGVGIIEPADDLNLANPPSNAELLNYLTQGFVASGYDMKWLHRTIATSDAYQRSRKPNATNEPDRRNFSHAMLRRLPAEVAMDALSSATAGAAELAQFHGDVKSRYIGLKTTQGGDGRGQRLYSLGIFGRPDRITTCDCERSNDPTLLQSLYLYNDAEMYKLINAGGWITDLARVERSKDFPTLVAFTRKRLAEYEKAGDNVRAEKTRAELVKMEAVRELNVADRDGLIEELYLRTVSRLPTADERARALQEVNASESTSEGMRQMLWVLLNTKEFILNH